MHVFENIISDRGSKYAVSGGPCASEDAAKAFIRDLKRKKKFAKATHHSWGLLTEAGPIRHDDGEGGGTFMDMADYDQVELGKDLLDDTLLYMAPNSTCTVLFHGDNPVAIELPSAVVLTIADTAPGIKGATATNQLKEAECDTGLKTRVPPFIAIGEKVRISTEDGSYMARVKED